MSIDLDDATLAKEFGLGCLTITGAHLWPVSYFVWEGTAKEVSCTFFGMDDGAKLLRIEVYKLPAAKKLVAERLDWYTRDRKQRRIKILDGILFDNDMLHVNAFDDRWEQDAFAISKHEIIRIYQTKGFAVFFRFLGSSETLLEHPIFKRAIRNIRLNESQWTRELPAIIEKRHKRTRSTKRA